jgi:hypothetical protein
MKNRIIEVERCYPNFCPWCKFSHSKSLHFCEYQGLPGERVSANIVTFPKWCPLKEENDVVS